MKQLGVTVYNPSKQGVPQLAFVVKRDGVEINLGTIEGSQVFVIQPGDVLELWEVIPLS